MIRKSNLLVTAAADTSGSNDVSTSTWTWGPWVHSFTFTPAVNTDVAVDTYSGAVSCGSFCFQTQGVWVTDPLRSV